jgi:NAD(P)-dependent dehydrogenase (short-subunit alcohol dehydrogenase family)
MRDLKDKTVLVTGGARGIGKGLARASLKEGARVIIVNRTQQIAEQTVEELSALGPIRALQCDVADRAAVDGMFDDIWAQEGPVNLVFSNAGFGGSAPIVEMPMPDVEQMMAVNFYSSLHVAQSYTPRIIGSDAQGHIVFTGSENSLFLPTFTADMAMGIYGVTKHAQLIMAEWLRYELRDTNVGVSFLMPGPVRTESLAATFEMLDKGKADPNAPVLMPANAEKALRELFITPDQCAEVALRGLKQGLFYIPTQPHIKEEAQHRYKELMASFDKLEL